MSFEDGPVSLFSSLDSMVENAFDGLEQAFENSENAENVDKKNETNVKVKRETYFEEENESTLHICDHCTFQTDDLEDFMDHIQSNLPHGLTCPSCPAEFQKKAQLTKHYQNKHHYQIKNGLQPTPSINCDSCNYQAVCKENLQKHKFTTHVKNVYSCVTCGYFYNTSEEFLQHLYIHSDHLHTVKTGQKIGKRNKRDRNEPKIDDKRKKVRIEYAKYNEDDGKLQCNTCDFKTEMRYNMQRHYIKHHTELYKCTECQYHATGKTELASHKLRMHSSERKTMKQKKLIPMKPEEAAQQQTVAYICDTCFVVLPSLPALLQHRNINHSTDSENPIITL